MIDISNYGPDELFDLTTLKVNVRNPRKIKPAAMERLKVSVLEFSKMLAKRPIVYDSDTMIPLGGNQRTKALLESGCTLVPKEWVMNADDFTDEEKRRFVLVDNGRFGEDDIEMLKEEYANDEVLDWGLDLDFDLLTKELAAEKKKEAKELEAVEDEFDVPDGGIETDIVIGDLFEIGPHRLLCGDSTDSDQVAKLMNGEKADMVFTDPPYKIQTEGGCKGITGEALKKQGKDIEFISDFNPSDFLNTLPIVFEHKKINAYIFCNKDLLPDYLFWAKEAGNSFNVLIWKKPNAIPIGDSHRPDIEYLLLFRKSAIWNNALEGVNYSRCLEFGRESGLHPTMKPIELIANEMKISSNINSIVFDFFLGSGSTMVAAHQLNRKCYGMELDPKYCQVIIDRMIKLDPTLEIKRNGVLIEP